MSPDDPRHGTNRGYILGCRDNCCTKAHRDYMNLYRMGRRPKLVDATGTIRRVQALLALGWTCRDIGLACNRGDEWARLVMRSRMVTPATAAAIGRAYESMCMTVPQRPDSARLRRLAVRKGYAPPLAWDDIDNDPAPVLMDKLKKDILDEAVIDKYLHGDFTQKATPAERAEIARRWARSGRSLSDLARLTGWKIERYYKAVA